MSAVLEEFYQECNRPGLHPQLATDDGGREGKKEGGESCQEVNGVGGVAFWAKFQDSLRPDPPPLLPADGHGQLLSSLSLFLSFLLLFFSRANCV